MTHPMQIAQDLDRHGWNVLPASTRRKAPKVAWKDWSSHRASHMIRFWFKLDKPTNYWIATGSVSGVYVLDIDNAGADQWWRSTELGPLMDATVAVRTAKGAHYYFSIPNDVERPGWSVHEAGLDFDIRGNGQGVIAPPSVHETGVVYEWLRSPDDTELVPAPEWLFSLAGVQARIGHEKPPEGSPAPSAADLGTKTASMLSQLLETPPTGAGRNVWLARVAGHYAKHFRSMPDLYQAQCRIALGLMANPLSEAEYRKTIDSIWASEHENHPNRAKPLAETGYLVKGDHEILTQVRIGKGDDTKYELRPWANFDLEVVAKVEGEVPGNMVFDCLMHRQIQHDTIPVALPGQYVGNPSKLTVWLAGFGVSIARPDNIYPASPGDSARLLRYLSSQDGVPSAKMAPALGWDVQGGFLTTEGEITVGGLQPFNGTRPDPKLREQNLDRSHYGFAGSAADAKATLAEVLTYHEPEVAAVFGGWWAACLLKPQFQDRLSQFPLMAIEAASGSGKTTGMFGLLVQLNGSIAGPGIATPAAARDLISAHNNRIVWLDDPNSLDPYAELLRVATSGETLAKKAQDYVGNIGVKLGSPVLLSGEHLGLDSQKALMDRVILLDPPKPDGRMSQRHPDRPQWDDITELARRHPGPLGLAVYSGHLIRAALELESAALDRLAEYRGQIRAEGLLTGRQADKTAVVLAGAWLLDQLAGTSLYEALAVDWSNGDRVSGESAGAWDNRLTTELLPWALRQWGQHADARNRRPVLVTSEGLLGTEVWVRASDLAQAWRHDHNGRITERTDTEAAIRQQIKRCPGWRQRYFDVATGGGGRSQARYWSIGPEASEVVLRRTQD